MIKGKVTTLLREDLSITKKDISIEDLSLSDFKIFLDEFIYEQDLIQFSDTGGNQTKILKNRYGKHGLVNGYDLDKTDLINLLLSIQTKSMQECDNLTKTGLMEFCGDQHNENWRWNKEKLKIFSENQIFELYKKYK